MTSLSADRAGVAPGVNDAVARVAALLAIANFGALMLNAFNNALDLRLDGMKLPTEARRQLDNDRCWPQKPPPASGAQSQTRSSLDFGGR